MTSVRKVTFQYPNATFTRDPSQDQRPIAPDTALISEAWPYGTEAIQLEEALYSDGAQPSAALLASRARHTAAEQLRQAQLDLLPAELQSLRAGISPFGPSIASPYSIFRVRTGPESQASLALGQLPQQLGAAPDRTSARRYLCLFNIIVALEWEPTESQFARLKWAFRRGSDFLYDVTEGTMAFGQVVFGGPELLGCADIQILASNRLLPRSWVDGLTNDRKHAPIRMGRGLWQKRFGRAIPWDEPEAFRTLVHEWAHYALGLKDRYLNINVGAAPSSDPSRLQLVAPALASEHLTLPSISQAVSSIMSFLEGTSELAPKLYEGNLTTNDTNNERTAINERYYPILLSDRKDRANGGIEPNDGPGSLPLPLPHFAAAGALERLVTYAEQPLFYEIRLYRIPIEFTKEHCWIYLLSPDGARIIDQGSLDLTYVGGFSAVSGVPERRIEFGFPLLGAQADDQVVLIGRSVAGANLCARGVIRHRPVPGNQLNHIVEWQPPTPSVPSVFVDVIPAPLNMARFSQIAEVRVEPAQPASIYLTGLADEQIRPITAEALADLTREAMDGHILIESEGLPLPIATFSQGGAPGSGFPVSPNPIPAGSSDGNALLFFGDQNERDNTPEQQELYASYRVITTRMQGDPGGLPAHARPASYAFSVASNQALLPQLNPTLVLFYDTVPDLSTHQLLVHHYDRATQAWQPVPTLVALNDFYAAIPLTAAACPGLFSGDAGHFVERFRLFLVERSPANQLAN
jgi:hypothetical protein